MNPFLVNLASERLGAAAIAANDEFFAPAAALVSDAPPVWKEHEYTDRGKWMDGWETRRRRAPGHDWCIVRLGLPGAVHALQVDTAFFTGNYPEDCSVDWCAIDDVLDVAKLHDYKHWRELLPRSPLKGNAVNGFDTQSSERATHLRLNIFPDGGVARLRVLGVVVPNWTELRARGEVDLIAVENGGSVVGCSDMFYGRPQNMLLPGRATHMGDGWETKRRRGPGNDWTSVRLGAPGRVRRLELDTTHFKGNAPGWASVDAASTDDAPRDHDWQPLLEQTALQPHTRHVYQVHAEQPVTHLRLNIFPDGGMARFRAWGQII